MISSRAAYRTAAVLITVCGCVAYFTTGGSPQGIASAEPSGPTPNTTLNTTLVNMTNGTITVVAGVGRANDITIDLMGADIRVKDTGDAVAPSGACTPVAANEAACPAAKATELVVNAGDQADKVTSTLGALGVTLIGGAGIDSLTGAAANDTLEGDADNDTLQGGAGNDTLTGGAGKDMILAGIDNDVVDGGPGDDTIFGDAGNDVLNGDDGNDLIVAVDASPGDFVDGGPGTNTCFADPGDTVINC
jgi:Ca2+-binding RTX toxin-like protein